MTRQAKFNIFFFYFCITIFFILTLIEPLRACDKDKFELIRVEDADIRLDGKLDEAIWMRIQPIKNWYQLTPNEGDISSEATEMRFFYDENNIYLGARLYVKNPATIFTRTFERDSYTPDQDSIALMIDALNDNRTGYGFIITSAGVKTDIAIFDDAETGDKPWNTEWNAFWDAMISDNYNSRLTTIKIPVLAAGGIDYPGIHGRRPGWFMIVKSGDCIC